MDEITLGTLLASTLRVSTPLILCALAGTCANAPASSTSGWKARC
jgi:ABC-type uncharacterized transport system permease subunit